MSHIQIFTTKPRVQYLADGLQRDFHYPFAIFSNENLEVYIGKELIRDGYLVAGAGDSSGGLVVFTEPPAAGSVITLRRQLVIQRTADFQESGPFRAKVINDDLDYLTAAIQQIETETARTIRLATTDADASLVLPDAGARAGKALVFDAQGALTARALSSDGGAAPWSSLDDIPEGDQNKHFENSYKSKLERIQDGAQVNAPVVSDEEKSNATLREVRSFSPRDIADMIACLARLADVDGGAADSVFTMNLDGGHARA